MDGTDRGSIRGPRGPKKGKAKKPPVVRIAGISKVSCGERVDGVKYRRVKFQSKYVK